MIIAIIGSGNVGGALAQSLIRAGHTVLIGAKFPLSEKSIQLAAKTGEDRFTSVSNAIKQAGVIIITTPPETVIELIPQLGNITGKVIIDATNSVRTRPGEYVSVFHAIKDLAKTDLVVKCFNSTGYENMQNPQYQGRGIDMFCAGNNSDAKNVAIQLAKDIGFGSCIDFGGDDKVLLLEQLALCWINLAIMQKMGRDIAFRIEKR